MGRPPHKPTDAMRAKVEMLAACALTQKEIAGVVGIDDLTLVKYYRAELDLGVAKVTGMVGNSLVKKAVSDRPDAVNAAKFFLERRRGWTEKVAHELSGAVEVHEVRQTFVRPPPRDDDD